MGWSGGSPLAWYIWDLVRQYIPLEKRREVALAIYDRFCDEDADDWDGTSQLEIDADINQTDEEDYDPIEDEEDYEAESSH